MQQSDPDTVGTVGGPSDMGPYPTLGRIVHYTNLGDADGRYPPEAHPAIVTKVRQTSDAPGDTRAVSLLIFYETGMFQMQNVPYSPIPMQRGHWNWPPRV